ncbi:transglycosylase SLT domain-containing protein [Nevskia sp.]|uniref:transglycosylase SLT domain-containing protein n=1 Tax=Nevskia sp. TaxID=1929292 RepID=UPI0025F2B5D6|nr:transglycosylase SLT domain-containing protein [Nevskia sp.]
MNTSSASMQLPARTIKASVGLGGINLKPDVLMVQMLLNRQIRVPRRLLDVDGVCGAQTISAIVALQISKRIPVRDGRVDPNGGTFRALRGTSTPSSGPGAISGAVEPTGHEKTGSISRAIRRIPGFSQPKTMLSVPPIVLYPLRDMPIAWGMKVSSDFKRKVQEIGAELDLSPDFLMACMAFESGETFSPDIRNAAGSGATGLIQFMPSTAKGLGTSTDALARMTAVTQLDFVRKYFLPHKGRLRTLEDVYMAILYPKAIGLDVNAALFSVGTKVYEQNKGFDRDVDGDITPAEISSKLRAAYQKGLSVGYLG